MTGACIYIPYYTTSFSPVHVLPWVITLLLISASIVRDRRGHWGKQAFLLFYGFYLWAWQFALWVFAVFFESMRPDPYCPEVLVAMFPSQTAFYLTAVTTVGIAYSFVWNIPISWVYWLIALGIYATAPFLLSWMLNNFLAEVLVSMGLGIVAAVAYVIAFRFYIVDELPFIMNQRPWTWFACRDTWTLGDHALDLAEELPACLRRCERITSARAEYGRLKHTLPSQPLLRSSSSWASRNNMATRYPITQKGAGRYKTWDLKSFQTSPV